MFCVFHNMFPTEITNIFVKLSSIHGYHCTRYLDVNFKMFSYCLNWRRNFNNNNKHFFNLQVANSPSRLRFEANLSRESSECTEHSQDQMNQINTGKTFYVGNA